MVAVVSLLLSAAITLPVLSLTAVTLYRKDHLSELAGASQVISISGR